MSGKNQGVFRGRLAEARGSAGAAYFIHAHTIVSF